MMGGDDPASHRLGRFAIRAVSRLAGCCVDQLEALVHSNLGRVDGFIGVGQLAWPPRNLGKHEAARRKCEAGVEDAAGLSGERGVHLGRWWTYSCLFGGF